MEAVHDIPFEISLRDEVIESLRADLAAEREAHEKTKIKLDRLMGMANAFPLEDVLKILIVATNHLMDDHNCDHQEHEIWKEVCVWANKYIDTINKNTKDGE